MLKESVIKPGFYHHPRVTPLVVSECGKVYNLILRRYLIPNVPKKKGYPVVNVSGYGTFGIHRLVCETFHTKPTSGSKLVVNHKDGNKLNPHKDNLEWTTYSGNSTHAYTSGLRKDNRCVELLDMVTNQLLEFYSLQACARHLRVNASKLHTYLNSNQDVAYKRRYNLRYKDGTWKNITVDQLSKKPNGVAQDVALHNEVDGTWYLFSSAGEAGVWLKCTGAAVSKAIRTKGKVCEIYRAYLLDTLGESVNGLDKRGQVVGKVKRDWLVRKPKPIITIDQISGESRSWGSTQEFADFVGVSKNTVQKGMWVNKGYWRQYQILYT